VNCIAVWLCGCVHGRRVGESQAVKPIKPPASHEQRVCVRVRVRVLVFSVWQLAGECESRFKIANRQNDTVVEHAATQHSAGGRTVAQCEEQQSVDKVNLSPPRPCPAQNCKTVFCTGVEVPSTGHGRDNGALSTLHTPPPTTASSLWPPQSSRSVVGHSKLPAHSRPWHRSHSSAGT